MTDKNIIWLKDVSKTDIESIGEKAAYLGEINKNKIPTPNAFIISTNFYKEILKEFSEQITGIVSQVSDYESATNVSNQIKERINQFVFTDELKELLLKNYKALGEPEHYKDIPEKTLNLISSGRDLPFIAVRASSTKAFPGLFKPVLNVYGIEQLVSAIRKILIEIFSTRALLFYYKNNINISDFSVAIVIQKMSNAKKCGDLFSINPIKNSKDEIYAQAIWGINNGYLDNPSISIFNKSTKQIVNEEIAKQETYITKNAQFGELISERIPEQAHSSSVLSQTELSILTDLAMKIEQIMNFPQHIEWVVERNNLQIIQTQPITRILNKPLTVQQSNAENVVAQGIPIINEYISGNALFDIQNQDDLSNSIFITKKLENQMLSQIIKSKGVVTSSKSLTSNLVLACKEFKIPCVIGIRELNNIIKEGQNIEIKDGSIIAMLEATSTPEYYSENTETETYSTAYSSESESKGFEDIYQYLIKLERYITELVSAEAQKRASGEHISEEDFKKSQKLSELEWQVRSIRKKLEDID